MANKYFCRNCHGLRNHKILFTKELKSEYDNDDDDAFQFIDKYLVIECDGCETVSFLNIYGDTSMVRNDREGDYKYYEDENIYPPYLAQGQVLSHSFYLPKDIKDIYSETITCFKAKAYVLTAGGFRAIIEAICNHLKIRKTNLSARIDLLYEKGSLTEKESKRLHSIRFIGNDALHEIETPKPNQLYIVLEIINHILENLFIQDRKIKGGLDSIIDNYEEFEKLLSNKISKELIGQELTMSKILGKAIRLIKDKKTLAQFETKFKSEIKTQKVDFLTIVKEGKETIYKIEKTPNFFFGLN